MNLEFIYQQVKAKGGRLTPLRKALVQILHAESEPISANQLIELMAEKGHQPNLTTIYRQLETLIECELVDRVVLSSKAQLFELRKGHHHHFVCQTCDEVKDVDSDDFESAIQVFEHELKSKGLSIQKHELTFFGACHSCN